MPTRIEFDLLTDNDYSGSLRYYNNGTDQYTSGGFYASFPLNTSERDFG